MLRLSPTHAVLPALVHQPIATDHATKFRWTKLANLRSQNFTLSTSKRVIEYPANIKKQQMSIFLDGGDSDDDVCPRVYPFVLSNIDHRGDSPLTGGGMSY